MKRLAFVVLAVLVSSCASSSVPFKLPPIIVTLPADSPAAPPVELVEQASLLVVVTDEDGKPIANMPVSLHTGELDDTKADGTVRWHELVRGPRHVVIHAGTTGFDSVEFDVKVDQAENTERVTLKRTVVDAPLVSLNIVVHDAVTGAGLPRATCTVGDESRSADGGGFINFAVRGSSAVRCAAGGYEARPAIELPPGDHRVPLVPVTPPAPPASEGGAPPASTDVRPGQLSPESVCAIAKTVHDAEGWNLGTGSDRDYRNRFWSRAVGVVHFGHPLYNLTADSRWHLKRGSSTRPQSDDVVVLMPSRAYWDCIPSAGLDGYSFRAGAHPEPLEASQPVYPPLKPDQGKVAPR